MLKTVIASCAFATLAAGIHAQDMDHAAMNHSAHMAAMADASRQSEVAKRGGDVMPFDLAWTTHVFTKTAEGGVQEVVVKKSADGQQVRLIRQHLHQIRAQFLAGDFAGPTQIHGQAMPGLAELKAAKPGQITISYKDVKGGAALTYATPHAALVAALHEWFDAQLSDHGHDAMEGDVHPHGGTMRH